MRALARDMYGVAVANSIEHDLQGAVHAEHDTIRMGYQLAGKWPKVKKDQAEYDAFKARMAKYKTDSRKNEASSVYAEY